MSRVVILGGGGLMGHGMALACLRNSNVEVVVVSRRKESLEHGERLVRMGPFGLERAVQRGKLSQLEADEMLSRLSFTLDNAAALATAGLVFETVPESVELKREVLRAAEQMSPATAAFATGTSAIMIAELASAMDRPQRLVGTHWFYPANVMPLVEVVKNERTEQAVVQHVLAFLREIGKRPVIVGDSPGFFMTRFVNTFIAEAIRAVELGIAGPAEIDEMVKTGLGWPMGVFELLDDTASFDSWYHAQGYLHQTCGERYAVPPLARRVFMSGHRGSPKLKPDSRGGWYDYFDIPRTTPAGASPS